MRIFKSVKKIRLLPVALFFVLLFNSGHSDGQMRQVYLDNNDPDNEIFKLSFYSASEGYVAFWNWIGYTTDSGRTFTKKYITLGNVNYNGYSVNLTFGFYINGVKAFNQNTILAYGHYGLVPAILRSTDGGNNYTLIYHSQYDPLQLRTGITDMIFPQNNTTGYAVDADRVLKTTDGGLSWSSIRNDPGSYFTNLEAVDNNNVFALSTEYTTNKLIKTANAGASWQAISLPVLPDGKMTYAHFLTATTGWLSMDADLSLGYFYKTTNGGSSWTLQNNANVTSFACGKMKFIDNNIGYALSGQNTVWKTFNSGVTWEPLPRDNNFTYLGYTHNDLQCLSVDQLWAGGGHGFLELSTNGGGTPIPQAYFLVDTIGQGTSGNVNLINYSRTGYSYQWLVNSTQVSTSYNAVYTHDIYSTRDTIKLIVSNGITADTTIQYQDFYPPVIVSSFTPTSAGTGNQVMITGLNFLGAGSVSFGGVSASFTVLSSTSIRANVGAGASGAVKVMTPTGQGSLGGFTYIPPPVISGFNPTSAAAGVTVTITGNNFNNVTAVSFAGIPATSFIVVSPTTITAVTPSGGSGSISVTAQGGSSSLAGFISLPTITSFNPLHGTYGTVLNISGTSFTGATAVTIGGINPQSFTVNSSTSITAIVGTGATGSVTVTKPGGSSTLAGFTWFPPPTITSFSPVSGPVGTTVVITGTNFHAIPANNTVFFGTVQATVTGGNTTSLTVTVPVGATFQPISVTSNNLTGYSKEPFLVTFPNGGSITGNSFNVRPEISAAGYTPYDAALGDIDGDGKLDLALINFGPFVIDNAVSILRNNSSGSSVSFEPKIDFTVGGDPQTVALGDLDGDGKLDFAVTNASNPANLGVYRNTSATGNISFAPPLNIATIPGPNGIVITDIDGDGKPDIAITTGDISVYRNISEPGMLAFAPRVDFSFGGANLIAADIDMDGKKDLVASSWNSGYIFLLKNTSTKGNPSFAPYITIGAAAPNSVAVGDVDGDGMPDLVATNAGGSNSSVFRNTGSPGNISFGPTIEFSTGSPSSGLILSDLDGDGKLDIAVSNGYNLTAIKNISQAGSILLAAWVGYPDNQFSGGNVATVGDINGDGKPDPVVLSEYERAVSIFINNVSPEPFIASFSPSIGATGTVVTITGNNFTGVTAVSFGGVPASSFTVNSATSITAIVGTGAAGNVSVTNNYGTGVRSGFAYGFPPVITSFSPASGAIGSVVTITGTGFNLTPENNTVYFGGVKATVNSSTATTLSVTVPAGISPRPISVTNNGLTAYSAKPFLVTYPGAGPAFYPGSFAPRFDRSSGGACKTGDIDGDGKPDLVLSKTNGISIGRNTSTVGNLSFAPNIVFTTTSSSSNALGDFDGDGKLDVVGLSDNSISVLRNTSSPGSVSFAPYISYSNGFDTRSSDITVGDMDLDGKPDIIVANYYTSSVSVFKNLSTAGNILFDTRIDLPVNGYPTGVTTGDLDGDGKPEIAATCNGTDVVALFRNTSIIGMMTFAPRLDIATGPGPNHVQFGDLDGDDKKEMVTSNGNSTMSIHRNTSTSGTISFAAKIDFVTGTRYVQIGDLDGDGKSEVTTFNLTSSLLSVFKNICTPGNIAFNSGIDYAMPGGAYAGDLADMDGDGMLDIVVGVSGGTNSILRNLTGNVVASVQVCANSTTTLTSNITGTTYQWEQNTGSGWTNVSNNTNFSGATTIDLQITNIPVSWNGYQFRCNVNSSRYSNTFILTVNAIAVPSVSITPSNNSICPGTTVNFTATPVNGGTAPTYQWQVNGVNVGNNSASYSSNSLTNGAQVKVIMTSNATCPSPATVTSNVITITVNSVTPAISISGPTTVSAGTPVLLTSSIANGGSSPQYFWQDSTNLHTWQNFTNGANANYAPAQTGNKVRCVLTSNANCATVTSVISNVLVFTVNPAIAVSVCANSTTTLTSNIAGTTYQWQQNTGTGWTNITNNTNFSGATTDNLQISNIPSSWNGYQYRCYVNPQYSYTFRLAISGTGAVPSVTIVANPGNSICAGTNVTFTATPTNGGTPSYQWKRNGINAGTNSSTYSNNTLVNGDVITVVMTSSLGCVSPATATSTGITMSVGTIVTPSVGITANPGNAICSGTNVTFTATPTNGGTPIFVWRRNGVDVGGNSNTYSTNTLANGDSVFVIMGSSLACVTESIVVSPVIAMTVGSTLTPSVSITANTGNTICPGTNVTFTATPTNGGTPSYQWKRNGSNVGANSNTYSNNALANGDVITVVMTSSLGCANPTTATATGITMSVVSTVSPSVSIAANPGNTICPGTNVTFTANPTNGGTPSYQWKLNGNNVGGNSNTYSNNTLANGDAVTVVMTSSLGCASPTTATSPGITMSVGSVVTSSVTIAANPGNNICSGTNVIFTATPTNGGTPSYQWKLNGNNVGVNSNTYSNNTLTNGDIITVVMTSSLACAIPATSNSITINLASSVTPSVSISANPGNTICTGTNVIFTASPTNGGTSPSYQWRLNGVNVGTNSNTYSNNALANGDSISVVMISSIGCANPVSVSSSKITMSVGSTITPSVTIAANPGNNICSGNNVIFTATPTNGGTPSYQWKLNGNNVGGNSNTYSNNTLANGDVVTVVMTSSIGCASPTIATSSGITMTVGSGVIPSVNISANPGTTFCAGTNVTFTATPVNGGTPSYQWKLNGNNVGTNSNTYSNNALIGTNQVAVVMTSSLACANPTTATTTLSTTTTASVTPAIIISGTTTVNAGIAVPLTSSITNGGNSPVYQWQDSTSLHSWQNISGSISANSTYTPALTGDKVRCLLTSNANCATPANVTSNILVFTVTTVTAVTPVAATNYGIRAYPNPVNKSLVIDSLKLSDQWQTLEITSIDGRQKIIVVKINGQRRLLIDVEKLTAGYYVAILRKKQGLRVYLTFIKQ